MEVTSIHKRKGVEDDEPLEKEHQQLDEEADSAETAAAETKEDIAGKRRKVVVTRDEGSGQQQQKEKEEEEEEDERARRLEKEKHRGGDEEEEEPFELRWSRFPGFVEGHVAQLFGVIPRIGVCDEPVHPSLVARGLRLLDVLSPPAPSDRDDQQEGEEDDESHEEKLQAGHVQIGRSEMRVRPYGGTAMEPLPPLEVTVGPWREDREASRCRARLATIRDPSPFKEAEDTEEDKREAEEAELIASGAGVYEIYHQGRPLVHVYRASGTVKTDGGKEELRSDRFELTHVFCGYDLEYIFILGKVERRYVFIGEYGCHPHCGTSDFHYNNSDGSGSGLFDEEERPPPTPMTLLAAAREHFIQFCSH